MYEQIFGLMAGNEQLPLTGVDVKASIVGRTVKVACRQKFENPYDRPLECIYKFPLPEGSACCGFLVISNDRTLEGVVEAREDAHSQYEKAITDKYGSYLLDEERPNTFTLSIGNLLPGSNVAIEISYVMLLDGSRDETRFFLPTTISPRYIPANMPAIEWTRHHGLINPPCFLDVPYRLRISITLYGKDHIKTISSPSHDITINDFENRMEVLLTQETTRMDRDFVLNITHRHVYPCNAFRCEHNGKSYVQIDFTAEMGISPHLVKDQAKELVFLLDCSGSMNGSSINQAKQALEAILRVLDSSMAFNVYCFGSSFDKLFDAPEPYNKKSLRAALSYLSKVDANKGGTEILPPLEDIYRVPLFKEERDVILITDGEVGNESEIAELVEKHAKHTRVHPLGIGYGPNEYFIKYLARSTQATSEQVYPGEDIALKAVKMFQKIIRGPMGSIRVSSNAATKVLPKPFLPYWGDVTTLLVRINALNSAPRHIFIKPHMNINDAIWDISIFPRKSADPGEQMILVQDIGTEDLHIPQMWARERIRQVEEGLHHGQWKRDDEKIRGSRKILVKVSKEYNVISSETSFIAVEKREESEDQTDEMITCRIPSMLTKDWHGISQGVADSCAFMSKSLPDAYLMHHLIKDEMEWSVRTMNCLTKANILTLGDLVQKTEKDLLLLNSFGKKSLTEIKSSLAGCGLSLGMQGPSLSEGTAEIHSLLLKNDAALKYDDIMLILLSHQRAEGGFDASPQLLCAIAMTEASAKKLAEKMKTKNETDKLVLLVTAIILCYLNTKLHAQKDFWDHLARKSFEWFNQQIAHHEPVIERKSLDKWARAYVNVL